jgi:phage portal protein BeeE
MPLEPEDYFIVFSGHVNTGSDGEMKVTTPVDTLSVTLNNWVNQAIARGAIIKDGGPKGIITNDDNSEFGNAMMSQKENDRINEAFKAKFGLVGKQFQVLVTQAALRWQAMSWNARELMLDETRKATMEDICFTLGWPYGLFDPSSQYSNNAAGEEKRAYTTVVMPDSEAYSQSLTEFLNQPNLKYYIDYSDVEALQKDKKA